MKMTKKFYEMKKERQEYLEKLYKKVVKEFSEIEEEKIDLRYVFLNYNITIILGERGLIYEKLEKPMIVAGTDFLKYSVEEQESVMAHELGHYMQDKDKDIVRMKCSSALQNKLSEWENGDIYLGRRKVERLKYANLIDEVSADNWAAKKGYSKGLLKNLNKLYDKITEETKQAVNRKEHLAERIANIEQKLESEQKSVEHVE